MYYGWVVVWATFVALTVLYMLMYSFPVFSLAFLEDLGWARGPTAMIFSIMQFVYTFASPVAGIWYDRFGARKVVTTGCLMVAVGFWANAHLDSLAGFYVTYGLVLALGFGLSAMVPHSAILMRWFGTRHDRGLATGIGTAGWRMGMLLVPLVQLLVFQVGWRGAFQWLAALVALVLVPLVLVAQRPASGARARVGAEPRLPADGRTPVVAAPVGGDLTLGQSMRTASFWWLIVSFIFYGLFFNLLMINLLPFLADRGWDEMWAATSVSMVSAVALISTVFWGFVADRLASWRTYALAGVVAGLAILMMAVFRSSGSPWPIYLGLALFGFGTGVSGVLLILSSDLFGKSHYGAIVGVLNMGYGFGSFIGPGLGGFIFDITGSYDLAFYLAAASVALSVFLTWQAFVHHPAASRRVAPSTAG